MCCYGLRCVFANLLSSSLSTSYCFDSCMCVCLMSSCHCIGIKAIVLWKRIWAINGPNAFNSLHIFNWIKGGNIFACALCLPSQPLFALSPFQMQCDCNLGENVLRIFYVYRTFRRCSVMSFEWMTFGRKARRFGQLLATKCENRFSSVKKNPNFAKKFGLIQGK